jgi:plastocyanin
MPTLTPTPVSIMPTDTIEFTNVGSSDWRISVNGTSVGVEPVLVLQKNETYTFTVNAAFHPLLLSTDGTATNQYINGVSPTGGSTSTLTFAVPSTAPATLYYVCLYHSSMRGRFEIVTP